MKDSKPSEPSLPFAWPFPVDGSESKHDDQSVPFAHLTAHAGSIAGIASDIDNRGVNWLEEFLGEPERRAVISPRRIRGLPDTVRAPSTIA